MKRLILMVLTFGFLNAIYAESTVKNYVYVKRDTCDLTMDVYTPLNIRPNTPCLLFVFGGGFKMGSKNNQYNVPYLKAMADSGYIVASIDYRLGMKGVKMKGSKKLQTLRKAINMAVEDLYSATEFLLKHAKDLNMDSSKIILSGSSAGAITVLQADYELANRTQIASEIPLGFHYAGVISFAGGILSYNGIPSYRIPPSPTMFFHGTNDKLVLYDKMQVFNIGFFGTNALVQQFEKYNYPYFVYRYRDMGHEIAGAPMKYNLSDICSFIREYVIQKHKLKKDLLVKNPEIKSSFYGKWKTRDLYK
jgi:predicted esterase